MAGKTVPWWRKALNYAIGRIGLFFRPANSEPPAGTAILAAPGAIEKVTEEEIALVEAAPTDKTLEEIDPEETILEDLALEDSPLTDPIQNPSPNTLPGQAEPETLAAESLAADDRPEISAGQPEISADRLEISAGQPESSAAESEIVTNPVEVLAVESVPASAAQKDEPAATQPAREPDLDPPAPPEREPDPAPAEPPAGDPQPAEPPATEPEPDPEDAPAPLKADAADAVAESPAATETVAVAATEEEPELAADPIEAPAVPTAADEVSQVEPAIELEAPATPETSGTEAAAPSVATSEGSSSAEPAQQSPAPAVKEPFKPRLQDAEADTFPISVFVGQVYDGPLDLLLDLIRKQDIDIYDIPIARITAQFLTYVDRLKATDVDVAGEFIYTASLLIHIKSKMLLPRAPSGPEDAPEDPRRELVERLLEHERFKNAAQMLQQKQMLEAASWTNPGVREFKHDAANEPELAADTTDLVRIFRDILERARKRPVFSVDEDSVTVGQMIQFLGRRLTMEDKPVALRKLLSHTRSERALIAMFLALLELVRLQAILLRQDRAFSEIFIKKNSGFETVMTERIANVDEWR